MSDVKLKVVRAFFLNGEVQAVDSTVSVSSAVAVELLNFGKAVAVDSAEVPQEKQKSRARAKETD